MKELNNKITVNEKPISYVKQYSAENVALKF